MDWVKSLRRVVPELLPWAAMCLAQLVIAGAAATVFVAVVTVLLGVEGERVYGRMWLAVTLAIFVVIMLVARRRRYAVSAFAHRVSKTPSAEGGTRTRTPEGTGT